MLTWVKVREIWALRVTECSGKASAERNKGRYVLKGCEEGMYLGMGGEVTNIARRNHEAARAHRGQEANDKSRNQVMMWVLKGSESPADV